jgi:hypothetical protein
MRILTATLVSATLVSAALVSTALAATTLAAALVSTALAATTLAAALAATTLAAALASASALTALATATLATSFAAPLSSFSRTLRVILEVSAASRTAFARDLAAFIFVHRRKAASRRATLIASTIFFSHDFTPFLYSHQLITGCPCWTAAEERSGSGCSFKKPT